MPPSSLSLSLSLSLSPCGCYFGSDCDLAGFLGCIEKYSNAESTHRKRDFSTPKARSMVFGVLV